MSFIKENITEACKEKIFEKEKLKQTFSEKNQTASKYYEIKYL